MHYIKLDQIISMALKHGPGALMAKFDVEAAYRNIAVHPDDRYLLGMKWRGQFFVDLALPFGLRSAPYTFNSVADMVEWIILNKYNVTDLMHYLDDFLMVGPAGSDQCALNLQISLAVCRSLGLPPHPGKCIGPATRLVVLGIELDSIEQSSRLPAEKLANLQELIQSWRSRWWCTRRQLDSLIGHLHHAAKVVWPGRTFLRRMIDLLCCFRTRDHPICLNSEFQLDVQWWHEFLVSWHGVSFWLFPGMSAATDVEVLDVQWWHEFLVSWHGVSFWLFPGMSAPTDVKVTSDAAGSLGFGAYFNTEWFSGAWAPSQAYQSIAYKELFPVVVASHVWDS